MGVVDKLKDCYDRLKFARQSATWKEPVRDDEGPFIFKWTDDGRRMKIFTKGKCSFEDAPFVSREHAQQLYEWLGRCLESNNSDR